MTMITKVCGFLMRFTDQSKRCPDTAHPARSWCKFLQVFTKQSITRSNEMYYNVLHRIALYSLYSQHELLPLHLIYLWMPYKPTRYISSFIHSTMTPRDGHLGCTKMLRHCSLCGVKYWRGSIHLWDKIPGIFLCPSRFQFDDLAAQEWPGPALWGCDVGDY